MTKEQEFYKALRDIFVGAKVEGESGYINLMRIKSRYYEKGVFPKLQKDIERALEPFPKFREELFLKLYTFFHRYFSESGSIYFRHTPIHQNIYERVYTDDKDVILFWKTHMLYYVKTDRLFKNLEAEIDGFKFFFDVSTLEHKRANEKRELVYEFSERRNDGAIAFNVYYSERGKKTRADEILKALRKEGIRISQDALENAFRVFERQSEVDYFINKNAREFLKEQFDIWLYQYVFSGESQWTEERIKQLQVLKDTASKIIDFISQFEDELVRIWNKPKFVLNSNYVITLDRVLAAACHCEERSDKASSSKKGVELIKKLLNHPNFDEQIKEWEELGIVGDDFVPSVILSDSEESQTLTSKYKHLPLDTKYFKDLEPEILELFGDLDNALDGWLIKSENYQALNTILPKFSGKVQTMYIDPPFNKEQDANYFYSVKYKDASWVTLLENRLQLAKDILKDTGSIFVRCDYNGNMYVRMLMNKVFGEENFKNEVMVNRSFRPTEEINRYHTAHDSLYLYTKSERYLFEGAVKPRENPKWRPMHLPGIRWSPIEPEYVNLFSPENLQERNGKIVSRARVIMGKEMLPPEGRHWALSQRGIFELEKQGEIKLDENGNPLALESGFQKVADNWTDITGYSVTWGFPTENSEVLLKRVIESTSRESDLVMDFFLGIGTAAAVAHKLGRRWIGVEMGEHFYRFQPERGKSSGVLVRMKEVVAGRGNHEPCGTSKEVNWQGGGFFKYYELEQYENALRKVRYEDSGLFENPYEDPYSQYVFMRDLKMLEALEIDYKNNKVNVDLSKLYQDIDIPETLSNLLGTGIKRIIPDKVDLENGETIDIKNLDYTLIKPLIWW